MSEPMLTEAPLSERFRCDGHCQCRKCAPDAFPDPSTISPVSGCYFSVDRGHYIANYVSIEGFLDGEPCEMVVSESFVGPEGWVVALTQDGAEDFGHLCKTCKQGVCRRVLHGHVEVHLGAAA